MRPATSTALPRSPCRFVSGRWSWAWRSAMTLVMGLFGGMVPAVRAVRMDVISALREL